MNSCGADTPVRVRALPALHTARTGVSAPHVISSGAETPAFHKMLESLHSRAHRKFNQEHVMPKYVIEREIPNAGKLTPRELPGISRKSCGIRRKAESEPA